MHNTTLKMKSDIKKKLIKKKCIIYLIVQMIYKPKLLDKNQGLKVGFRTVTVNNRTDNVSKIARGIHIYGEQQSAQI